MRRNRFVSRIAIAVLFGGLPGLAAQDSSGTVPSSWLHITAANRTVHNSNYLAASFLYQLQTLLGGDEGSPNVMAGKIVRRRSTELYIDLEQLPRKEATLVRQIATQKQPADEISLEEMSS